MQGIIQGRHILRIINESLRNAEEYGKEFPEQYVEFEVLTNVKDMESLRNARMADAHDETC